VRTTSSSILTVTGTSNGATNSVVLQLTVKN
jgi:hypothetical protein